MGRRKKAQKVVKKKQKIEVATTFKCLFCNHERSVSCKLNLNSMIGELVCRICDAKFETQINSLTDPIDVFSEWLDEANDLQEEEHRRQTQGLPSRSTGYIGDGHDYVPGEDNEVGEDDDASIVGSDNGDIDPVGDDGDDDAGNGDADVDVNEVAPNINTTTAEAADTLTSKANEEQEGDNANTGAEAGAGAGAVADADADANANKLVNSSLSSVLNTFAAATGDVCGDDSDDDLFGDN